MYTYIFGWKETFRGLKLITIREKKLYFKPSINHNEALREAGEKREKKNYLRLEKTVWFMLNFGQHFIVSDVYHLIG